MQDDAWFLVIFWTVINFVKICALLPPKLTNPAWPVNQFYNFHDPILELLHHVTTEREAEYALHEYWDPQAEAMRQAAQVNLSLTEEDTNSDKDKENATEMPSHSSFGANAKGGVARRTLFLMNWHGQLASTTGLTGPDQLSEIPLIAHLSLPWRNRLVLLTMNNMLKCRYCIKFCISSITLRMDKMESSL